ncbi:hypothetical protein FHW04_004206 [Pantoea sp. AN62]
MNLTGDLLQRGVVDPGGQRQRAVETPQQR